MNKDYKLTENGKNELEVELKKLQSSRGRLTEAIKVAREQGDLAENSEYHDAKDAQGVAESRITEIEHILHNAEIVSATNTTEVELGNLVELKTDGGKTVSYIVVSSVEASPADRKISDASPIGKALLGSKVGDKVSVDLPAGTVTYSVEKIS